MMNPMFMASSILAVSLLVTILMFKMTLTSWLSFVTILTFSSGMMTLFMYTASLTSNESTKQKKAGVIFAVMMMVSMSVPTSSHSYLKQSMNMFSSNTVLVIIASLLMVTMLAISSHGHHPNQTVSASF